MTAEPQQLTLLEPPPEPARVPVDDGSFEWLVLYGPRQTDEEEPETL